MPTSTGFYQSKGPYGNVRLAKLHQKQQYGTVDASSVVAAAPRARKRARTTLQQDAVEELVQAADIATQQNVDQWSDRSIPFETLRDEIDPKCADELALLTAALRRGTPLATFREQVARSRRRVERDKKLRAAGAVLRREGGFSKTYTHKDGRRQKVVRTGAQVKKKAQRDRAVKLLPKKKRPTYASQTTIGHGLRFLGAGSRKHVVKRTHARGPASKRSQAEISAQAQAQLVRGPYGRGEYQMQIPSAQWSTKALSRIGFGRKPQRCFSFRGPTAEADAEAFARTMMEWLENPNRVKPPPHPRKP